MRATTVDWSHDRASWQIPHFTPNQQRHITGDEAPFADFSRLPVRERGPLVWNRGILIPILAFHTSFSLFSILSSLTLEALQEDLQTQFVQALAFRQTSSVCLSNTTRCPFSQRSPAAVDLVGRRSLTSPSGFLLLPVSIPDRRHTRARCVCFHTFVSSPPQFVKINSGNGVRVWSNRV